MTPQDRQILLTVADHTTDLKFRIAVHAVLLRLDELEADAERLDWLGDRVYFGSMECGALIGPLVNRGESLRAAVDRAMKGGA